MFCKLIGQNDQDDTYQALENTCGCTYCIISLADAPFQYININRLGELLYQSVSYRY